MTTNPTGAITEIFVADSLTKVNLSSSNSMKKGMYNAPNFTRCVKWITSI